MPRVETMRHVLHLKMEETVLDLTVPIAKNPNGTFQLLWLGKDLEKILSEMTPPLSEGCYTVDGERQAYDGLQWVLRQSAQGVLNITTDDWVLVWEDTNTYQDGTLGPVWVGADFCSDGIWTQQGVEVSDFEKYLNGTVVSDAIGAQQFQFIMKDHWQKVFDCFCPISSSKDEKRDIDWASFHAQGQCLALSFWLRNPSCPVFYEPAYESQSSTVTASFRDCVMARSDLGPSCQAQLLVAAASFGVDSGPWSASEHSVIKALGAGADPTALIFYGQSALHVAARLGNEKMLRLMQTHVDQHCGKGTAARLLDATGSSVSTAALWGGLIEFAIENAPHLLGEAPSFPPLIQLIQTAFYGPDDNHGWRELARRLINDPSQPRGRQECGDAKDYLLLKNQDWLEALLETRDLSVVTNTPPVAIRSKPSI